jgi:hypothetical protein
VTPRDSDPSPRIAPHMVITDDVAALMVEAAAGAAMRLGMQDPAQIAGDLEKLCQALSTAGSGDGDGDGDGDGTLSESLDGDELDGSQSLLGSRARHDAALMTGVLWTVVRTAGDRYPAAAGSLVVTDLFDVRWLEQLSTPEPADLGTASGPGWAPLVSAWLSALFDGAVDARCHDDSPVVGEPTASSQWNFCVVLQLSGRTIWRLESEAGEPDGMTSAATHPGDLVLVPETMPHRTAVSDAGSCRHVAFAFHRQS